MMRDLRDYQREYERLPFEATQAKYRKRRIVETLHRYSARRILEVGCGLDPIFVHYPSFESMVVVEPCDDFADNARRLAVGHTNVAIVQGMFERLVGDVISGAFDFILLSSLLHEVENPAELLKAAGALCASETMVHINVPNAMSVHRLLAVEMGLIDRPDEQSDTQKRMQQGRVFDMASLRATVESAGFRVVEAGSFFIKPFTHSQMEALQRCGLVTDQMLDGLYAMGRHFPDNGAELYINARLGQ